jgi:hypothetical protein
MRRHVRWILVAATGVMTFSSGPEVLDASLSPGLRAVHFGLIAGMLASTIWVWRHPERTR